MARPRLPKRKVNLQSEKCGFYDKVNKRCNITKEGMLICDYKHCTLHKTKEQVAEDKKRYGGRK